MNKSKNLESKISMLCFQTISGLDHGVIMAFGSRHGLATDLSETLHTRLHNYYRSKYDVKIADGLNEPLCREMYYLMWNNII